METFLEQFFVLLITPPGNLIYHLVLIFSITAAFQALLASRQDRATQQIRQSMIVFGLLLLCQIGLFISVGLSWQGLFVPDKILPPLYRAISVLCLLWVVYLWCFPLPAKNITLSVIIISATIIAFFAYSVIAWDTATPYNLSWFNQIWTILSVFFIIYGMVVLSLKRPDNWVVGQVFLVINLLTSIAHIFVYLPYENYAAAIRLGHLCSFPLLPSIALRHQTSAAEKYKTDTSLSSEAARKKIDANKKIISNLTNELEKAQTQITSLQNEKEESRIKFQQLSQDILFLSSQINLNDVPDVGTESSTEITSEEESKGDQVLRVWIEQIQKDNDELHQENKQLMQKNLSLTAKIKQFQWDQEIDTEELDSLQIENENIEYLLNELNTEFDHIDTLLTTHSQNYSEARNIGSTNRQHIQSLKEIIDTIHHFLDPQAQTIPLQALPTNTGYEKPKTNIEDNQQVPVEAFEAELELLLGDDVTHPAAIKDTIEKEEELGLPQFLKDIPHREKTQPLKIKKSKRTESDTSSDIGENFVYRQKDFDESEYRKQLNEQLKRLRVQGAEHQNQRVGEIVPHLSPLFTKAQQALNILLSVLEESETSSLRQEEIASKIKQQLDSIEEKQAELNQLVQESMSDISTAKVISSELKIKNQQLRASIEKAKEAQKRAEEIADEQLNENSDLRTANEKFEKQVNDQKSKLEELNLQLTKAVEEQQNAEKSLQVLTEEKENIAHQLQQAAADLKEAPEEISRLEANLAEMTQKIDVMADELESTKQENSENIRVISEMVNELVQPASSIQGYTDLLLSETVGKLGAAHLKFAELIRSSALRLSEAVNSLNLNVKENLGNEVTQPSIDIQTVINQAIDSIGQIKSKKNINIQTTGVENIQHNIAEEDLLKQVTIQLLENACLHSPENGIVELKAALETADDQSQIISIQVSDQGEKYSDEELDKLFLSQEDDVGLSVAKTLVESQQGDIRVENGDAGPAVYISLPIESA